MARRNAARSANRWGHDSKSSNPLWVIDTNVVRGTRKPGRTVAADTSRQLNVVIRAMLIIVVYIELLLVISSILNHANLLESVQQSVIIAGLVPKPLEIDTFDGAARAADSF